MTRAHKLKAKAPRRRPVEPPVRDSRYVQPLDSEDQAGTYAPPRSADDTGESDEGVFAQGPPPPKVSRAKRKHGGAPMRPKKKRIGHEQPDPVKDEIPETIGGTDGELGDDEDYVKSEVEESGGYHRPAELGEDDELI